MSEENFETLKRMNEAGNRHDIDALVTELGRFLSGKFSAGTLPYVAGYCVGDVGGERGDCAAHGPALLRRQVW